MHPLTRLRRYFLRTSLIIAVVVAATPSLRAQAPESLKFVPADVAFYSSGSRLREQYDAFVNSNAYAKLQSMPIVQMGMGLLQQQWNNPEGLGQLKAFIEAPENQQLVALATDAVSHEIFVYGDEGFGDMVEFATELNQANQRAQMMALAGDVDNIQEVMLQQIMQVVEKHLDTLQVPDAVIGFRLTDSQRATAELNRAEQLLTAILAQQPGLGERLSRSQIAGGDFLSLQLDGSLIPWAALEQQGGAEITKIRDKVSKMTLSVTLGVKDNFLLLSIGDNNDHLAALGQGDLLAARKELAGLKQHAQKPITSVNYVSGDFAQRANPAGQQINQLLAFAEAFLQNVGDPMLQQEIVKDVNDFTEDLKNAISKTGAVSSFSFRTDRGYEGYSYNWSENNRSDGSKPLTILDHVGGDPLLVIAGRRKYSLESYDKVAKWIGRAIYYAEKIGVAQLGEEEREFYQKVRADLVPLVSRLDQVTREKLMPAFRDGQSAFVLDTKTTSNQLHENLPPSSEALPIPEIGLVYSVSDPEMLKGAASEYFTIAQQIIDTLHEADPNKIPPLKLPPPESRDFPGGTIFYYRLPRELGLDKQISPNAGLSQDTLVLTPIPKMTVRLLANTPLKGVGPVADRNNPLSAAFQFNFAGLLDAITPWVDYGVGLSDGAIDQGTLSQIETGIEILKCFRGASGVTYQEDDAWVSHYESFWRDLP
jgi:hypothetical protein